MDSPVEGVAEEDATPVADESAAGKTPSVNGPRVASRVRKPNVCVWAGMAEAVVKNIYM
jgi:hypothetical protein